MKAERRPVQPDRRLSKASARCAASTMRKMRWQPLPPAWRLGSSLGEIQRGLESFPGLAHRMEQVGTNGQGVCSSTIPRRPMPRPRRRRCRASRASTGLPAACPRKAASKPLRGSFPRIAKAYLIGEAAPAFAATLGEAAPFEISGTLAAAVAHAAHDAAQRPGDEAVVLLSPACASFDQFKNFEVRGDAFRACRAWPSTAYQPIGGHKLMVKPC